LYDNANVAIASTVTDANGFYMFSNLNPGTYTVGFSNIPVNTAFTTKSAAGSTAANNSDVNVATGRTDAITLVAGQVKTDVDAGLISNFAAVGDFVWYDVNSNGRQDAGEPGVAGVTVTLYDANGNRVASAVTDGNGRYFINNIPVPATGATFTIGFTDLPTNFIAYTIKSAPGTTTANNSNANQNGRTDAFTLVPGQVDITIDAGILTDTGGPLPVTVTSLTGIYTNGIAKLNWATLSEQNFSHFEVEYSTDGASFNKLGNVNGAGNSNSRINYGFNHLQPIAGVNYYRLKLVDKDGKFTYTNTVALNVTIKGLTITAVYPNPFTDRVNVSITAAGTDKATVKLFDNAGKLVYSNETTVQRGNNTITINNLAKLAAGTYLIQVNAGDAVLTKQLMK
jgi:SdrD B-like domain/Secretion system C-terminal sorting domain